MSTPVVFNPAGAAPNLRRTGDAGSVFFAGNVSQLSRTLCKQRLSENTQIRGKNARLRHPPPDFTFAAVSAPNTGSFGSVSNPICFNTDAWSQ